jgi:hypothetical protein
MRATFFPSPIEDRSRRLQSRSVRALLRMRCNARYYARVATHVSLRVRRYARDCYSFGARRVMIGTAVESAA